MSRKVRVGIVGIGNCASSFVQGISHYGAEANIPLPGLMHPELGGYFVSDIEIASAFDVNAKKVGLDVADAIFARRRLRLRQLHPARARAPFHRRRGRQRMIQAFGG